MAWKIIREVPLSNTDRVFKKFTEEVAQPVAIVSVGPNLDDNNMLMYLFQTDVNAEIASSPSEHCLHTYTFGAEQKSYFMIMNEIESAIVAFRAKLCRELRELGMKTLVCIWNTTLEDYSAITLFSKEERGEEDYARLFKHSALPDIVQSALRSQPPTGAEGWDYVVHHDNEGEYSDKRE